MLNIQVNVWVMESVKLTGRQLLDYVLKCSGSDGVVSQTTSPSGCDPPCEVGAIEVSKVSKKLDIRLPEKGNSNSRGARPVY